MKKIAKVIIAAIAVVAFSYFVLSYTNSDNFTESVNQATDILSE